MPGPVDWPRTLMSSPPDRRLYRRPRLRAADSLLLILVDASGSTLRGEGLSAAKGVVGRLLQQAYLQRRRVALLSFAGLRVTPLFGPARPPRDPEPLLARIHGGGGTPLAIALTRASELLRRERLSHPQQAQSLVLLTDGRCDGPMPAPPDDVESLVVDLERGAVRLRRARSLARSLSADYLPITACLPKSQGRPM